MCFILWDCDSQSSVGAKTNFRRIAFREVIQLCGNSNFNRKCDAFTLVRKISILEGVWWSLKFLSVELSVTIFSERDFLSLKSFYPAKHEAGGRFAGFVWECLACIRGVNWSLTPVTGLGERRVRGPGDWETRVHPVSRHHQFTSLQPLSGGRLSNVVTCPSVGHSPSPEEDTRWRRRPGRLSCSLGPKM